MTQKPSASLKLSEFVAELESELARLNSLVAGNAELIIADIHGIQEAPLSADVRDVMVGIYSKTAELLGRNTPDAVRADIVARLGLLVANHQVSDTKERNCSPEEFVTQSVRPRLDVDMQKHAFDMEVYQRHFPKLYNIIKVGRARGFKNTERFSSQRDRGIGPRRRGKDTFLPQLVRGLDLTETIRSFDNLLRHGSRTPKGAKPSPRNK